MLYIGAVKCGHCLMKFDLDPDGGDYLVYRDRIKNDDGDEVRICVLNYQCPYCERPNLYLDVDPGTNGNMAIWPFDSRPDCSPEVPSHIREDYEEARLVLRFSHKASLALSRRCLQSLLQDVAKVDSDNLFKAIDGLLGDGKLPPTLAGSIDAIRNLGNLAVHPNTNVDDGSMVFVTQGEAEWALDILEELFDYYYVQPKAIQSKRDALNEKLTRAGKSQMK